MKFKIEFELFDGTCAGCPSCGFEPESIEVMCNADFPNRRVDLRTKRPEWCPLVEVKDANA
jgi:hypothetical protein